MPADGTQATRQPITRISADGFRGVAIDARTEAGRAALQSFTHIPDEERARWAKPWDPTQDPLVAGLVAQMKAVR